MNFVTRDLWKLCEGYGKVVDVNIPNRKSKAGKRFAFVRFIKVEDIDRLIGNLCTIWIGRLHLYANVVRYERPRKPSNSAGHVQANMHVPSGSYATIVKGNTQSNTPVTPPSTIPALVLDDSCVIERDLSRYVMGRVKQVKSIPNLQTILTKEGFSEFKLTYLGGMWVMIELDNEVTKQKMLQHIGVKSWFQVFQAAKQDFVSDERVVWVDIEEVPLNVWTRETFLKIYMKWVETIDIEENLYSSFARKRLCIKTKQEDNILEKFKVILKGKVYMVRAKELFAWTLIFLDYKVSEYISDDESLHGAENKPVGLQYGDDELEDDNDVEGVSETDFGDKPSSPNDSVCKRIEKMVEQHLEDPFNIYDLLKNPKGDTQDSNTTFSHPPGYTSKVLETRQENVQVVVDQNNETDKVNSCTSQEVHENVTSKGEYAIHSTYNSQTGCSILEVIDGIGHKKKNEWVKELNIKHKVNFIALQETKMDRVTQMDVKFIWGNSNYQYVSSDSVGSSGGILCVWEATVFKKDYATVSDIFIAIYGTWISNNTKVLIVNLDSGIASDEILFKRIELMQQLHDIKKMEARDNIQKSKIKWAIEGDENSKFFHGIINKKRSQMSIREVDGDWKTDPDVVKDAFKDHFAARFKQPANGRLKLIIPFTNRLSTEQAADMDRCVSRDEICIAVWNCGDNNSPGPDGLTLLKSVLGASLLYNMSIYKVPKGVLNEMEAIRNSTVASKLGSLSLEVSFRRSVCDGFERQQLLGLNSLTGSLILSSSKDRWICDLNGDGEFRVKDVRIKLYDILLPSDSNATRWVKYIPIKINVFAWCVWLDLLSTRSNLILRGVVLESPLCPMCGLIPEDIHYVIFRCDIAQFVFRRICRWWDLDWQDLFTFQIGMLGFLLYV
nr:RNA-directed DNA polymerase, eukaryota, reverse transcriptase zinc-binding domain protein [Tanacetum cinerariifolium]